jgi:hypothetical protein
LAAGEEGEPASFPSPAKRSAAGFKLKGPSPAYPAPTAASIAGEVAGFDFGVDVVPKLDFVNSVTKLA